jgi:hypothetical protein
MVSVLAWIIAGLLVWLVCRFVARTMKIPAEPSADPADDAEVGAHLKPKPRGRSGAVAVEPETEAADIEVVGRTKPLNKQSS